MTITGSRGETRVNTKTDSTQSDSFATALDGGGWIVVWYSPSNNLSGGTVHQQQYDSKGLAIGGEVQVNADLIGVIARPKVAALLNGGWVVTWVDDDQGGSRGVYQQCYNSSGVRLGEQTRVNSTLEGEQQQEAITALSDGGWIVTWSTQKLNTGEYVIHQQRYNAGAQPVGDETEVASFSPNSQNCSFNALSGGGWLVTWVGAGQDGTQEVFQQRYDAAWQAVGTKIQANTFTHGTQSNAIVTMLPDGGWLVTWVSSSQETAPVGIFPGKGIYQQRFNAGGAKIGGEVHVNTTTVGDQHEQSVTTLADGGWLVTWSSRHQDENGFGIYQQRYDSIGRAVGGETRVHTTTAEDQVESSVTALSDGGWLVTWSSGEANVDIYQQRFAADGQKVGPTTPTGINVAVQAVAEGGSAPAGQLSAKAFVPGHSFTLLDDAGGRFALSASGAITVKDGIRLDYEQAQSHQIKVQVSDALGVTFEQWVQIQVADVASENLIGSTSADVLKGSGGNDALHGGLGHDRLYGDTGNDVLYAGAGNDRLYGGQGRDTFVFDTRTNKSTNVDKLYDFKYLDDKFLLENSIFTKLGKGSAAGLRFKSDMFVNGTKAQDAEDRIVYDRKTGNLYYDKDGTGGSAQVKIATLTNKTKLYYHDFFVI